MARPPLRFIPRSEAPRKFASRRLKKAYWELSEQRFTKSPGAIPADLLEALSAKASIFLRVRSIGGDMEYYVVKWLRGGLRG
jgi:hypothetical protein